MADEADFLKRIGLTRGKMVLIGVLAVVLVGVLYIQYGGSGAEDVALSVAPVMDTAPALSAPTPSSESVAAPASAGPAPPVGLNEPRADSLDQTKWKSPDVSTVVRYDPFASPPGFPRLAQVAGDPQGLLGGDADAASRASRLADSVAQLQSDLEALRQRGVHVIVRQHDEFVAMIGDRTVRVGDEINGFTVTAIDPDGVRVERKVEP